MERLATLNPFFCCIHFTLLNNRVKVSGHEDVHLRVEGGEESPEHREKVDGIDKEVMRNLVNWAEVKAIVGTGEVAEVDHQWVFRADVVVQADTPAAVVEGGDCIKVFSDPFKVASLLMDC